MALRIGLISDTHGLLRPEALRFLRGCDRIVHAGDICDPAHLEALAALAPLTAVRGNCDRGPWAEALPGTGFLQVGGLCLCVVHDLSSLRLPAEAGAVRVVVSGHSHQPGVREREGVLYVNPGSAGPRRFRLPVSLGELRVEDGAASARIQELDV